MNIHDTTINRIPLFKHPLGCWHRLVPQITSPLAPASAYHAIFYCDVPSLLGVRTGHGRGLGGGRQRHRRSVPLVPRHLTSSTGLSTSSEDQSGPHHQLGHFDTASCPAEFTDDAAPLQQASSVFGFSGGWPATATSRRIEKASKSSVQHTGMIF